MARGQLGVLYGISPELEGATKVHQVQRNTASLAALVIYPGEIRIFRPGKWIPSYNLDQRLICAFPLFSAYTITGLTDQEHTVNAQS